MTNAEIAAALEELAVLYQLDGADRYRVLAYVNSARTIRTEGSSVEEMAKNGTVTDLPGVGKTLEEKILALIDTGAIPAAVKLKEKLPAGLIEINRIERALDREELSELDLGVVAAPTVEPPAFGAGQAVEQLTGSPEVDLAVERARHVERQRGDERLAHLDALRSAVD